MTSTITDLTADDYYGRSDDWKLSGLCAQSDPDEWYPERGGGASLATDAAIAVCDRCPVQARCLLYGLDGEEQFGIWGGATTTKLRTLRRAGRLAELGAVWEVAARRALPVPDGVMEQVAALLEEWFPELLDGDPDGEEPDLDLVALLDELDRQPAAA